MTRQGDFCIKHIEVLRREECISEKRFRELKRWSEFREEHSEISELTEGACTPLMRVEDPEIGAKSIEAIAENVLHGNTPTAREVKQIIENKRADAKPLKMVVPAVVVDMEGQMEEERIAQEARKLQQRNNEDEREQEALEEKNENTLAQNRLIESLTNDFKTAIKERLPTRYIGAAIDTAFRNAFEALQDTPENRGITQYTKKERDLQELKARVAKQEAWALEDAKKEAPATEGVAV